MGVASLGPYKTWQIANLEKIQKTAARFVTGNYSLIEGNTIKNMNLLGGSPLSECRTKSKLITLYGNIRLH